LKEVILSFGSSFTYEAIIIFIAAFPITIAALAINSSRQYRLDRSRVQTENYFPHQAQRQLAHHQWQLVSVIIPARNEEKYLAKSISAALNLQWPEIEVIVINDGSTDGTEAVIADFSDDVRVSVITHEKPKGKSASLNEGIAAAKSEIVLILDADSVPARNVLDRMVSHIAIAPDVAAVTGNPRVAELPNILTKLQAIEFSSTISTLRRGQSAWGRVNTVSGIMTVFRKSYIREMGGFASDQPTEDIELTWRLHRSGFRCIYEPAAQVGMQVPITLRHWYKQRSRWSKGLVRVIQRHGLGILKNKEWPAFPIVFEALLAIIWCHLLVVMTGLWIVAWINGISTIGNSLILGSWGVMAVGVAVVQIFWGMHLDSIYDKRIKDLWVLAPVYPLLYWMMSAGVVVITTIPTLLTKPKSVAWDLPRSESAAG